MKYPAFVLFVLLCSGPALGEAPCPTTPQVQLTCDESIEEIEAKIEALEQALAAAEQDQKAKPSPENARYVSALQSELAAHQSILVAHQSTGETDTDPGEHCIVLYL